jgi:hypothetical protein
MAAKHTPTPWEVGLEDALSGVPFIEINADSENYREICQVSCTLVGGSSWQLTDEDRANAVFLVRAANAHAELVAALEGVLPLAEAYADGKTGSHPDHEWIEVARAALAKAEA